MALLNFFKSTRHQRYNYIPRFYDPKKEALEERLRIMKGVKEGDTESIKKKIRGGFGGAGYTPGVSTYRNRQASRSNAIILVLIVVLVILAYILANVYLDEIVNLTEGKSM